MALTDSQMDQFVAHVKTRTQLHKPMSDSKEFSFGYETLCWRKVDARG